MATLGNLEAAVASHLREAQHLDNEIRKFREETGWRARLPEMLGGVSPGQALSASMARREEVDHAIQDIEKQIDRGKRDLQCIESRIAGETCDSLLDKLSAAGKTGYAQIAAIVDKSSRMVTSMVRLTITIVIKNILFPIVFLIIALKYSLPVIRYAVRKTSAWQRDLKELPNSLRQLD